ncbi:MAG: hypothetical protein LBK66_08585 [Spirochaetaceae bacterium]|jgi:hypothetical protein|nr:hypothetical protein [Spirochaetaceae bacterium]
MTVIEIKNMVRKDVPIYYRRAYTGSAIIEIAGKTESMRADWTIETTPLGTKETTVTLTGTIDYPLLPIIKELKKKIEYLDAEGKLPL